MNDRLDEWLARLPDEPPAPDLTARIVWAVSQRRRARVVWRRATAAVLVCAVFGLALVGLAWPEITLPLAAAQTAPQSSDVVSTLDALLAAPLDTAAGWMSAALTWQTTLAESVSEALMLGVVLLVTAALGGLARLLHRTAPLNGHATSH